MSKNDKSNKSQNDKISDQSNLDLIDMVLGQKEHKIVDSETMILETQKRIWGALKQGYEYTGITDESEKFLRKNVFSKFDIIVLYVDLVGSTTMTLELPEDKLAIIISSFALEMASVITLHGGYVLKFVGDAVIGYFVASENPLLAADNAAIILSILQANLTKGEQRGAASLFFERVEQDLEGLRGLGARSSSNGSTLRSFLVKRGFFRKTF